MRKILFILFFIVSIACNAANLIYQTDSEKVYFFPEYSNAFNYSDGRKGYTVFVRQIYTITQNGIKSVDMELEYNPDWSKVRIMKWFYNDANNQLVSWETTKPQSWQIVNPSRLAGKIREGVKKYFR